ncbi:hypothetical protein [Nocardia sp. NPDC056000]|uniref:hypothetical protein n=1 Tax=Nocardia sp. NPDC056000 TaxID=3345674 RepID=UPI0035D73449
MVDRIGAFAVLAIAIGLFAIGIGVANLSSDPDGAATALQVAGAILFSAVAIIIAIWNFDAWQVRRERAMAAETSESEPAGSSAVAVPAMLGDVRLHSTVELALRSAAAQTAPRPLDTQVLFLTLMRADSSGQWYRLWLHTGGARRITARPAQDPTNYTAATWQGYPLTFATARSLDIAARLSRRYDIWPLTVGMLAIALIADPASGAVRALGPNADRRAILDVLQTDVLGVELTDLTLVLAAVLHETPAPPAEITHGSNPGVVQRIPVLQRRYPVLVACLGLIGVAAVVLGSVVG